MDESLGHRYLCLAGSHGFMPWQTDEIEAKCLGHSHRLSKKSTSRRKATFLAIAAVRVKEARHSPNLRQGQSTSQGQSPSQSQTQRPGQGYRKSPSHSHAIIGTIVIANFIRKRFAIDP